MAVTIVEEARPITGGVDTHADTHVAAALDSVGGLLGVREFPATAAGYSRLLGWLGGFGTVCLVGIEGTSYGAGLARHVTAAGIRVIVPLVTARAPGLLALYGIGPRTAALLLIAAGDHPGRLFPGPGACRPR
jgi:Transposase